MNRAEFVAALGAATAAPRSRAAVTAEIDIRRDADDLLSPFTVSIAVRNVTARIVSLDFPIADVYRIDVRHDDRTIWSTASGHKPISIARRLDVAPGLTRLASQIVDGTTDDHRSYAPGRYVVRVAMLGSSLNTTIEKAIAFDAPITIAQALQTKGGTVITIAGVPSVDAGAYHLRDATGTLRLSRPLGRRPTGIYVVRGYLDALGDDVAFSVGRFAPAFENAPPEKAPA